MSDSPRKLSGLPWPKNVPVAEFEVYQVGPRDVNTNGTPPIPVTASYSPPVVCGLRFLPRIDSLCMLDSFQKTGKISPLPGPDGPGRSWIRENSDGRNRPSIVYELFSCTASSAAGPGSAGSVAARPPPANKSAPERLNLSTYGTPSGKGKMPSSSPLWLWYKTICFCPAMATTGAQGLEAIAVTAPGRDGWASGTRGNPSGMTAGPAGFPEPAESEGMPAKR